MNSGGQFAVRPCSFSCDDWPGPGELWRVALMAFLHWWVGQNIIVQVSPHENEVPLPDRSSRHSPGAHPHLHPTDAFADLRGLDSQTQTGH